MQLEAVRVVCVGALAALLIVGGGVACGPSDRASPDGGGTAACPEGPTRCLGGSFQRCDGDGYVTETVCSASEVCAPDDGCVPGCREGAQFVCVGDERHTCLEDRSVGPLVEACFEGARCTPGGCVVDPNCTDAAANFIYVVDLDRNLVRFDPLTFDYELVAHLACPDPDLTATPFSMAVDRRGIAWILYSDGRLFQASIEDGTCVATAWERGTGGFWTFGMGFSVDTAGEDAERLWINNGTLGVIDPQTLAVTPIGATAPATYWAELTGTGDASLYGYYPGDPSSVVRFDKLTAQSLDSHTVPGQAGAAIGWAFAQWGGWFYLFFTTIAPDDPEQIPVARVFRLDPATGQTELVVEGAPHIVVGAGVSTCAPIVID